MLSESKRASHTLVVERRLESSGSTGPTDSISRGYDKIEERRNLQAFRTYLIDCTRNKAGYVLLTSKNKWK